MGGPDWDVHAFGGAANGFGTNASDLDVSISARQEPAAPPLHVLQMTLPNTDKFSVDDLIGRAKVPVLKLKYERQYDVDVTCNNHAALANTRLLLAYSMIDARVKQLVVNVKSWAMAKACCGAKDGHLASYSFT